MILTEEEAKTKRCCGGPNCGKYGGCVDDNLCIGSACMAWRWHDKPVQPMTLPINESEHVSGMLKRDGSPYVEGDGDNRRAMQRWKPRFQPTGYCGKAGKP
jgi:hypothetical protein